MDVELYGSEVRVFLAKRDLLLLLELALRPADINFVWLERQTDAGLLTVLVEGNDEHYMGRSDADAVIRQQPVPHVSAPAGEVNACDARGYHLGESGRATCISCPAEYRDPLVQLPFRYIRSS